MAGETATSTTTGSALLQSAVAQAATVVAVLLAGVYVCGALVFIVRLGLLDLPTTSVLGQLPHNLLLTTGATEVILPAVFGGTVLAFWISPRSLLPGRPVRLASFQLAVASIVLTVAAGTAYRWAQRQRLLPGVLPHNVWLWVVVPTFLVTFGALTGALFTTRRFPRRQKRRRLWAGGLFAIALIPGCAISFGASPLPAVFVCRNKDLEPLTFDGDLIGTSGGNYYVAQFHHARGRVEGRRILVIPQDQTRFITLARKVPSETKCAP